MHTPFLQQATNQFFAQISPRAVANKKEERFKLRMTSSSSGDESVEVVLPAEVFTTVASSSRRTSRSALTAPIKSVLFAVRGGKLFNATTVSSEVFICNVIVNYFLRQQVVSVNIGNVTIANLNQPIKIDFYNNITIGDDDVTNNSLLVG